MAAVALGIAAPAAGETIPVAPGSADGIATGVNGAQPGDVIELASGTYSGTATITASGSAELPIVIRAAVGASPVWDAGGSPGDTDREALILDGASWITLEGVRFINAWLNVIELRDSSYVTIREVHFDDTGQYAVWTDGHGSHHVLVEDCEWSQDERVYTEWDWTELHHGSLGHYNGGFYGGREGAGGAVIRRNYIHHVFNVTGGNRTLAARILGLDRKTLYRKLRRYEAGGVGESG